jgi:hypothetical protein
MESQALEKEEFEKNSRMMKTAATIYGVIDTLEKYEISEAKKILFRMAQELEAKTSHNPIPKYPDPPPPPPDTDIHFSGYRKQSIPKRSKCRIVERTHPSGRKEWVIQQRHFLFRWMWVSAWVNMGTGYQDTFRTLEEAKSNLWMFDGSKPNDITVWP